MAPPNCTNFSTCGAALDYQVQLYTAGTYQVFIRYQSTGSAKVRYRLGSVDETVSLSATTSWAWATPSKSGVFAVGDQDLTVSMVTPGVLIDKIVILAPGGVIPTTDGGPESCANTCTVTGTTQQCTVKTYAPDAESFECGVGSNLKCCAASSTQFYCSPVGQTCGNLDTVTGETWSTPVVAPVKLSTNRTWMIFFGSGYNNRPGLPAAVGRSVYSIEATSGTLRGRWDYDDLPTTSLNPSTLDNTIPGGVAVFDYTTTGTDPTPDGFADVVYVGDLEGRLWKIDIHASGAPGTGGIVSLTTWPTCELFDAADQNNNGSRDWAPIITTPAVTTIKQDTTSTSYLPYVFFGTGGDDRAPSNILYRFYAVKDTVTCPPSTTPTIITAKHEVDIHNDPSGLEWIVGDGKKNDTTHGALSPSDAEGTIGQRYWSDPIIFQNAVVYFSSLNGSIESVNPCDNLTGGSLLFGYAIHDFFSGASTASKAGNSIVQLSGFAGTAPYYKSASKIRRSAMIATQMPTAGVAQPPPANAVPGSANQQIFIQTFDGNIRSITPPTVNNVNTIRVLRWREIPLF